MTNENISASKLTEPPYIAWPIHTYLTCKMCCINIYAHPISSASPKDSALPLPSCLQAVSALFLVNPLMHIVPHWLLKKSSSLPVPSPAKNPANRRSPWR